MHLPFLAAEYTNICAFATFRESSAVELLTEPKVLRPCGRPPRPGAVRCAGVSPLPPPPSRRTPRLCGSRFHGSRLRGLPVLAGTARRRSVRDPATPVAFGLPVARNVYTFPHLASLPSRAWSASETCPRSYPLVRICKICIPLHGIPPPRPPRIRRRVESERRETRLRATLRSPIGAAYELVS